MNHPTAALDIGAKITKPATLSKLVKDIDSLNWYSVDRNDLGDLYEDLLERNAGEKKSGPGQHSAPRHLIDSIVSVMKPQLGEVIQHPTAGTCRFLGAANNCLRQHKDFDSLSEEAQRKYRHHTFHGLELVQDTHRLALNRADRMQLKHGRNCAFWAMPSFALRPNRWGPLHE